MTLAPERGGTHLRVIHSGLSPAYSELHAHGWDTLLPLLSAQAAGAPAPEAAAALTQAEELASRVNSALIRLRHALEGCPEERWKTAKTGEGWAIAAGSEHVLRHLQVAQQARALANGEPSMLSGLTVDQLDAGNAVEAAQFATTPRAQVLAELLDQGPKAVEVVKGFTDAELARTFPMAFAGGEPMALSVILTAALVADLEGHVASVETAIEGAAS